MKSFLPIVVTLALTAVFAPAALADSSTSSTPSAPSSTPASTTTTSTTTDTPPPAPTTTTTTTTDVSPTTTTTPGVPTTTTTNVPTGTATTTTNGDDLLPMDVAEACTEATCIPVDASGTGPIGAAGTGTAGALPFTGVGDMIAPVLLALTVLLGGVVAWRWAQLRESVARDADVAIEAPVRSKHTGYQRALRMQEIDRRARSVFEPRVA